MGKTKTKIIDDSLPQVEEKKKIRGKKRAQSESADSTAILNTPTSLSVNSAEQSEESPANAGLKQVEGSFANAHNDKKNKPQKPTKAKPGSRRYQKVSKNLDKTKTYPLFEAIDLVKRVNYAKFDSTMEAHINTVSTGIRGLVSLPFASGKKLRILAFGLSKNSGVEGVTIGDDSKVEEINKGKVDFDLIITTPAWMSKLAKAARVLGPKGLMPNPKNGTITDDLEKTIKSFQTGKTEYKTEAKSPLIHLALGKLSQPNEQLSANIKTLLQIIGKTKVKKVSLSPTMGPSVKVDLGSI